MESSSFICVLILKLSLQQSILYPNLHRQEGMLPLLLSDFSRPTLCDPMDGSPPGSAVPGILQTRTLEWVAISFSNALKWKVKVKLLSHVRLFATPWTAVYQAPPSMGFSRQEYWSGVPLPSPRKVKALAKPLLLGDITKEEYERYFSPTSCSSAPTVTNSVC